QICVNEIDRVFAICRQSCRQRFTWLFGNIEECYPCSCTGKALRKSCPDTGPPAGNQNACILQIRKTGIFTAPCHRHSLPQPLVNSIIWNYVQLIGIIRRSFVSCQAFGKGCEGKCPTIMSHHWVSQAQKSP